MLGPPGLGGLAQHSTSLFRTDVPPPRGTKTDRRPLDRFRREPSARNIQQFDREIEEDFWWQARLTHHAPEASRSSRPKDT